MDLDQQQDIARSSYADMLHDDERNHAYYVAIRTVTNYLVTSKKQNPNKDRLFKCCDIGAGSGLLSMMVARSFLALNYSAFHVTAYECFKPMSDAAKAIIDSNGLSKYITVNEERVGFNEVHQNPKYDLLVAELLDTELIGEGCLEVYRFVIEHLCSPECIFIPQEAKIYIEPIGSRGLFRRQFLKDQVIQLDSRQEIVIESDKGVKSCSGLMELDDMQTSLLGDSFGFERITEPKIAFEIQFNNLESLKINDSTRLHFKVKGKLKQEIVIHMWWDVIMYDGSLFADYGPPNNSIKYSFSRLSNAPTWCRNHYQRERDGLIEKLYNRTIWREHWMQAIYYLPCHEGVRSLLGKNEEYVEFDIYANHDAYSLWFDLTPCKSNKPPPSCTCGLHRRVNRYEVSFLNNSPVLQDLVKAMAQSSIDKYDRNRHRTLKGRLKLLVDNEFEGNKWRLDFWFKNDSEFNIEPVFSLLDYSLMDDVCWQVILNRFMEDQDVRPIASFKIVVNQVMFHSLNRIRTKVGHCQGFDLRELDRLIEDSARLVDSSVEAHHLWEYSCDIISPDIVVFDSEQAKQQKSPNFNLIERIALPIPEKSIQILRSQWTLVFSCNVKLSNGKIIRTGCLNSGSTESAKWNHYFKQLVYFVHNHPMLDDAAKLRQIKTLDFSIELTRSGLSVKCG